MRASADSAAGAGKHINLATIFSPFQKKKTAILFYDLQSERASRRARSAALDPDKYFRSRSLTDYV